MQDAENDTTLVTQDYMYSAAFQGTPLAKSILGTSESLRYTNCSFLIVHFISVVHAGTKNGRLLLWVKNIAAVLLSIT